MKYIFKLYILKLAWGKCDPENCPDMGGAFSCGVIISGTGDNIKCGYLTSARNKYTVQQDTCKGKMVFSLYSTKHRYVFYWLFERFNFLNFQKANKKA